MNPSLLHFTISASCGAAYVPYLRRNLLKAHQLLQSPVRELSLALVGDRRMSALHQQFMKIKGPTDVLTFPLDLDARGRVVSGEVVLCVSEARRRARIEKVALRKELLLYGLHGLLHLCGFDDRTDHDFAVMHHTEDDILSKLGIGPVFRATSGQCPAGASPLPRRPIGRTGGARA